MSININKAGLLAGVSAAVLGFATMGALPAKAFDDVNWRWDAQINETITKTGVINFTLEPTGMVMLEDLQISIGDVTANSTVSGIYNHQPSGPGEGGPMEVDLGSIDVDAQYGLGGDFLPGGTATGDVVTGTIENGNVNETDIPADGVNGSVSTTIDLGSITVEMEPGESEPLDALTELPEVISAATAVANNTSISGDTALQLHEEQWAVGDITLGGENSASDGLSLGSLGSVEPAKVKATSEVYDILNASVDSSATAVGNNLTVDIEATGDDRLAIADVKQIAIADVSAKSDVYDINVYNYTNMGALDRPLVNSVATAVGNNKSISVNVPSVNPGGDTGGGE
ncbi:hypothetical protein [Iodidimonas sp. SYSU 1G8]|uniref:hypothetical protein n=1 Tax=Iodidimonas sp. SYSU 1G8 TaxID=3133967 RepID=UPI0031FF2EC2